MTDNPRFEYNGNLNKTITGRHCVEWTSHSLWPNYTFPEYTDPDLKSNPNVKGPGPVCRKPDGTKGPPWCYVNSTHREDCNLPKCGKS